MPNSVQNVCCLTLLCSAHQASSGQDQTIALQGTVASPSFKSSVQICSRACFFFFFWWFVFPRLFENHPALAVRSSLVPLPSVIPILLSCWLFFLPSAFLSCKAECLDTGLSTQPSTGYSLGSLVHGSWAWLQCLTVQLAYSTTLSLSCHTLHLLLAAAVLLLALLRWGRAVIVLSLTTGLCSCLGKEPDTSMELCGEQMLAWSADRKSGKMMALCSCNSIQSKPVDSWKALALAVVLG